MHTACLLTRKGESFMAPPSQHPPLHGTPFMEPHFRKKPLSQNPLHWTPLHGTPLYQNPIPPSQHPSFMVPSASQNPLPFYGTSRMAPGRMGPLRTAPPRMAPLPCEQTNTSGNITFPQLCLPAVIMDSFCASSAWVWTLCSWSTDRWQHRTHVTGVKRKVHPTRYHCKPDRYPTSGP